MSNLKNTLNTDLNIEKTSNKFIKTISNIDLTNFKVEFMNSLQYSLLSIIPVILTLKLIKNVIPDIDETKGSLELLFESVGQISLTIFMLLSINTLVRCIPTYSEVNYTNIDFYSYIVPFIFLILTMQTKIGGKINILSYRFLDYWNGDKTQVPKNNANITTNNLLPNPNNVINNQINRPVNTHVNNQVNNPTNTHVNNPSNTRANNSQSTNVPQTKESNSHMNYNTHKPDFNDMYKNNNNNTLEENEPIAANLGVNSVYSNW
jgi:hypothetical protein